LRVRGLDGGLELAAAGLAGPCRYGQIAFCLLDHVLRPLLAILLVSGT
jgi:hypothetical protein